MDDDRHYSPEEFLKRMDAGDFDGHLHAELDKLSKEELSEVARALMEQEDKRLGFGTV